ncbi:MAG: hypothetical protein M1823_004658 [Watsoniomyces obsoletus]|nr:MAG: hypothetical protein M1823_004658 [Watsoniomyces obsoletus]
MRAATLWTMVLCLFSATIYASRENGHISRVIRVPELPNDKLKGLYRRSTESAVLVWPSEQIFKWCVWCVESCLQNIMDVLQSQQLALAWQPNCFENCNKHIEPRGYQCPKNTFFKIPVEVRRVDQERAEPPALPQAEELKGPRVTKELKRNGRWDLTTFSKLAQSVKGWAHSVKIPEGLPDWRSFAGSLKWKPPPVPVNRSPIRVPVR